VLLALSNSKNRMKILSIRLLSVKSPKETNQSNPETATLGRKPKNSTLSKEKSGHRVNP